MNTPKQIRAGDTTKWKESAPSDPDGNVLSSSSWTMKIELIGPQRYTVSATADGSNYQFTIAVSVSKTFLPGFYKWVGYVEKTSDASERYTIGGGTLEILQNLALMQGGLDGRSHIRRALDLINAAIETWATKPQSVTIATGIANQTVTYKSLPDLLAAKSHYEYLLKREESDQKIANGLRPGNKIKTHFVRTS